jgi:hypothetical protein
LYTEIRDKMRRPKLLHPIISDMSRELSVAVLVRAGAFKRPMKFPFLHLEVVAPDHVRVFKVGNKANQTPQIVPIDWRKMSFGWRPYFLCPRCSLRREYLFHDGITCYCRCCGDLRFLSQRKRARSRLLIRSHRIRVKLGDETGKPGDPFPPRPYLQRKTRYRRTIAALSQIERDYLHHSEITRRNLYRERDERGCFVAAEDDAQSITDDRD